MDKVTVNWAEYKKWYHRHGSTHVWMVDGRNKVTLTGETMVCEGEKCLGFMCGSIGGVIPERFITITKKAQ